MNSNKTPEANPGFAGYILDETASANYIAMLSCRPPRVAGISRKQHRHPAKASSKPAARMSPLLLVLAMRQFPEVASEHIRQAVEQQVQTLIAKNTQKAGA